MISIEELRKRLRYDPATGILYWKDGQRLGLPAGYLDTTGYVRLGFAGRMYLNHRIAWALHYGIWPDLEVDHINGQKTDNRLGNLRLATKAENRRNVKTRSDNKTGFKGVSFCKRTGRYKAQIRHGQTHPKFLGYFDTPEQAATAYRKAALELHGEFARFA